MPFHLATRVGSWCWRSAHRRWRGDHARRRGDPPGLGRKPDLRPQEPDALRRQAAVRELGAVKYRAATPDIVPLVHDPVAAVRREVEFSLERMEDIQALPGFIVLASDLENDIRSRAVASLINIHLPRENALGAALTKLGELMMLTPDRDLEMIVDPDVPVDPDVIATLRARIGDPERGIRRTAIRGLGILCARPAVPDLLQVVREDRDDGLRFDGVRALRKIADASIADQLVALLNVNSDTVRNELMATLGSMRYRGAVPELTRIVEQATPASTPQIVALAALADIADPASVPVFERFRADKNEALRLYANEGVARTADANQKSAISAARLVERSARVRTAQAFALLRIGEPEFLDELIRGLDRRQPASWRRSICSRFGRRTAMRCSRRDRPAPPPAPSSRM